MNPVTQLTAWVALKHQGQIIRRTTIPYFNHLTAVAEMAGPLEELGYETGLCHDLLEDTDTTSSELWNALLSFGYTEKQADKITSSVVELTDVFTAVAYPELSKKERKKKEADRLVSISATAQTVKYADLIYNIEWVLKFDQKHAGKYLKKKKLLMESLNRGDAGLQKQLAGAIHTGIVFIKKLEQGA